MKRIILIVLVITAAVTAALILVSRHKPAPKATDLLPESSLLVLCAPDFAKSRADFHSTAAYALWHEPEVQAFLEKPLRTLRETVGGHAGAGPDETVAKLILGSLQGEVFLAVTGVTMLPVPQIGVVAGADVKGKRIETAATMARLEHRLKADHPEIQITAKRYLGVQYTSWEIRPGVNVCHTFLNTLVVFTLGEDTMRDTIARFTGQVASATASLTASLKYQNVVNHMPKDYEFLAYINIEQLVSLVGPMLAVVPQGAGIMQKLARIEASGVSVTFTDGNVQDVAFVAQTGTNSVPPAATQRMTLALTTPQTMLYSVRTSDPMTAYDELIQSLATAGNPGLASAAVQFEQTLRRRGVRVREDLLTQLGPEVALLGAWRPGAPIPDVALVAEFKDSEPARAALDAALDALKEVALGSDEQVPWEETQHLGSTLRSVHISEDKISPTYTTTKKFFILALNSDYVRELLDQAAKPKNTLAANPDYEQAMRPLPAHAYSYTYCDVKSLVEPLHGLVSKALSTVPTGDFIEPTKLPHSATVARHLSPFVSATLGDNQSETITTFSPFGMPAVVVAGVVGAVIVARNVALTPELINPPASPKTSSEKAFPPTPRGNQTAASQSPSTQ